MLSGAMGVVKIISMIVAIFSMRRTVWVVKLNPVFIPI
jgi:hypothetical protein